MCNLPPTAEFSCSHADALAPRGEAVEDRLSTDWAVAASESHVSRTSQEDIQNIVRDRDDLKRGEVKYGPKSLGQAAFSYV